MTDPLTTAFLRLQLPILASSEQLADEATSDAMRASGVDEQDAADLLDLHITEWLETGVCSVILRTVIDRCILVASDPAVSKILGGSYVDWFDKFAEKYGLPRATTRMLLARSQLIADLLLEERMSASQIVRLLHSLEPTVDVPFSAIQDLASRLGRCPALGSAEIESIWAADAARSQLIFPEGDLFESCSAAASAAQDFGVPPQLEELLKTLLSNGVDGPLNPIIPYLQMLHFALCPIEFYDHCPTRLYE
ncbi:MAG: hypothetical protein O3C27_05795, partial [Actinomycetota bacterium]|nr:hypothetical protein [Actinomycetota bacterium]